MRMHFIWQDPWVAPGEYLAFARRRGIEVSSTRCWLFEKLPREPVGDVLVVLGGDQNPATTRQECAYFDGPGEMELIRRYVQDSRVVIGSCLGAQLVGCALGAGYEHSPEREIGAVRLSLTREGREDPFLKDFPASFEGGQWHADMPGVTGQAKVLARSEGCPRQIVRYGRFVYGFQTHMEFTREIVAEGIRAAGGEIRAQGPYVQSASELLSYDYGPMNHLLSLFLERLLSAYEVTRE